ncbi:uncharacterized protein LOC120258737 [Dioscorea cayenensis subsp. rotundata]|uniref:Cholesterol oxidase n=1 Tax=Dioscorea cayennensis subsp. rotundata TaxID=55577 RepID=A0AB40B4Y7_DIOCR|nr:uncharacterized protein LOC120258737 [Dioscorea cayenensis subsp. rotundata]
MEIGEESYDVIVVGSGYGGSVVACRLSMAGAKVCLIEKGKQWSAQDFPTNSLSILAATKMEFSKWGFGFGSDKALFQVYEQGDTLCCVACGLGGGSLVNAAVLTATPVRARRNPRWPEEWNNDWESCQATASAMLGSNSIPSEFSSAKVMKQVAEEEIENFRADKIELGINFGQELKHQTKGGQEIGSCVACGNCLSGCPYNAKNSNDKTYITSAIQAGCVVKTECEIIYIIKTDAQGDGEENRCNSIKENRRWKVHFDNLEHVSADFVILSAGVLGTTKILFDSERRGLSLSPMLGYGFSCNGNNVAYVAGSQAPLNAYGLNKRQFTTIPLQDRPGPTITSSYTSSLGFTIQAAVLPTSYPYMLFKGIATYGWPNGCWFLHGLIDKMKHLMGLKASQAMVLNVMGYDSCDGRITFDKETNKIRFTQAHDPLLLRKIQALQSISKKLGGILFMSRYRSTSVHLLGGCNAALDPSNGVCNPKGQVFDMSGDQPAVHKGLYVCDASLIPCSIGINPILTITTASEYISKHLVKEVQNFRNQFRRNEVIMTTRLAEEICDSTMHSEKSVRLQSHSGVQIMKDKENVTFKETLKGFIGGMPCTAYLAVKMNSGCKITFSHPLLKGKVGGYVLFQAISKEPLYIIDGEIDLLALNDRTPYTQYMHYRLILASQSGSRYLMEGKKVMNPYIMATYAWKESRTLHVNFRGLSEKDDNQSKVYGDIEQKVDLRGELHLSVVELLKSLISMRGNRKRRFIYLLLQSLWRTYISQVPREVEPRLTSFDKDTKTYPPSTLHELKTGDGHFISCQQWKSGDVNTWKSEGQRYPILLLNGYSGESFCLPTEPTDLVRTLVEQGYETWSLQSRVHPKHASNNFTIEDIAKFDIPAVITKIQELHGQNTKNSCDSTLCWRLINSYCSIRRLCLCSSYSISLLCQRLHVLQANKISPC